MHNVRVINSKSRSFYDVALFVFRIILIPVTFEQCVSAYVYDRVCASDEVDTME